MGVNPGDDDDFKFGWVIYRIENQDTGADDLKDTGGDSRKSGKYYEDIEQRSIIGDEREHVQIMSEANRKEESREEKYCGHDMVHSYE